MKPLGNASPRTGGLSSELGAAAAAAAGSHLHRLPILATLPKSNNTTTPLKMPRNGYNKWRMLRILMLAITIKSKNTSQIIKTNCGEINRSMIYFPGNCIHLNGWPRQCTKSTTFTRKSGSRWPSRLLTRCSRLARLIVIWLMRLIRAWARNSRNPNSLRINPPTAPKAHSALSHPTTRRLAVHPMLNSKDSNSLSNRKGVAAAATADVEFELENKILRSW